MSYIIISCLYFGVMNIVLLNLCCIISAQQKLPIPDQFSVKNFPKTYLSYGHSLKILLVSTQNVYPTNENK